MKDIISKNSYELAKEFGVEHKKMLKIIEHIEKDLNTLDMSNNNSVFTFHTHFKYKPYITTKGRELPRYDMDFAGYQYVCNKLRCPIAMQMQSDIIKKSLF